MTGARDARLARYLNRSTDQRRLISKMVAGHARQKHGRELGDVTAVAFATRIRAHLSNAPFAARVSDPAGRPRYLVADAGTNQVAWITPHKEHRSTLFTPRDGVDTYVRAQQLATPPSGWQSIDLAAARAPERGAARATHRAITSSARITQSTEAARVP